MGPVAVMGENVAESRSRTAIGWDGMNKLFRRENPFNIVLSVSLTDEDCASLQRIFESVWIVTSISTVASALSLLRRTTIPIVICDSDISAGTWREMLNEIWLLPDPPLFIVTSRLADERTRVKSSELSVSLGNIGRIVTRPYQPHRTKEVRKRNRIYGCDWNTAFSETTK
jgi:hypothetical protein